MKPDPMEDAERIAALLDGRLDERQRAEVLARLGESEAALEAFVDAAAVLPETQPRALHRRGWRTIAIPLAVAAAIGIVAVLVPRSKHHEPERFAALLSPSASAYPRGWNGAPWTVSRGGGETISDTARAIRIGARLTDLALAAKTGDSARYVIAGDIATLLDPIPASSPVASRYRAAARSGEIPDGTSAAQMAGQDLVDLGAWLEAARFAAMRADSAFFQSTASVTMMRRIASEWPIASQSGQPIDWRDLLSKLGS